MITYARIGIKYRHIRAGIKVAVATAFPVETPHLGFHITNPAEVPAGLQGGLISYQPDDKVCRFITTARVEGALKLEASL